MLKITDKLEDKEILVTRGAYENLYKRLGYKIVGDKKETTVKKEEKLPEPVVSEPAVKEEPKEEKTDDLFDDIMAKKSYHRKK